MGLNCKKNLTTFIIFSVNFNTHEVTEHFQNHLLQTQHKFLLDADAPWPLLKTENKFYGGFCQDKVDLNTEVKSCCEGGIALKCRNCGNCEKPQTHVDSKLPSLFSSIIIFSWKFPFLFNFPSHGNVNPGAGENGASPEYFGVLFSGL